MVLVYRGEHMIAVRELENAASSIVDITQSISLFRLPDMFLPPPPPPHHNPQCSLAWTKPRHRWLPRAPWCSSAYPSGRTGGKSWEGGKQGGGNERTGKRTELDGTFRDVDALQGMHMLYKVDVGGTFRDVASGRACSTNGREPHVGRTNPRTRRGRDMRGSPWEGLWDRKMGSLGLRLRMGCCRSTQRRGRAILWFAQHLSCLSLLYSRPLFPPATHLCMTLTLWQLRSYFCFAQHLMAKNPKNIDGTAKEMLNHSTASGLNQMSSIPGSGPVKIAWGGGVRVVVHFCCLPFYRKQSSHDVPLQQALPRNRQKTVAGPKLIRSDKKKQGWADNYLHPRVDACAYSSQSANKKIQASVLLRNG